ncbi:MAG TPA: TrkA family potassium uptake protein [Anaerolineales bacterium]|nr:TrkA family potassium uptake protein [Anaerolineales bacterium]
MKVIVMGCGRIGSQVSRLLATQSHDVTVIDHDANADGRLGPNFKGRIIKGLGFDRNVLLEAGIEQADAFVSASQSDNANIVSARIARNIFHVPRVVARLYDPRRAEIYQRLGLTTISSTNWGAERIFQVLTHTELDVWDTFGRGEVSLVHLEVPPHLVNRSVTQLNVPGEVMVVSITRNEQAFIPITGTEFKEGDLINLVVLSSSMDRLEEMLGIERR